MFWNVFFGQIIVELQYDVRNISGDGIGCLKIKVMGEYNEVHEYENRKIWKGRRKVIYWSTIASSVSAYKWIGMYVASCCIESSCVEGWRDL